MDETGQKTVGLRSAKAGMHKNRTPVTKNEIIENNETPQNQRTQADAGRVLSRLSRVTRRPGRTPLTPA